MKGNYRSFGEMKELINKTLTDATKCYILANYVYNTEDTSKKYKDEFKKRYTNFYKTIINIEDEMNGMFRNEACETFKQILNLDYFKSKMDFFNSENMDMELEDIDDSIDIDYEVKAAMSSVKLNFYHSNRVEFGNNTRYHVDTSKYGVINPSPSNEEERMFIFLSLTNYYYNNCLVEEKDNTKKLINKNM
jgi:hypothetical protein